MNNNGFSRRIGSLLFLAVGHLVGIAFGHECLAGEFFPLGSLSISTRASSAWGVDDSGKIVVGYAASDEFAPSDEGFVWTEETGMIGLGAASTRVVSADGSTVAGWTKVLTDEGSYTFRTYLWTRAGGMQILPLPDGASGYESSFVSALSSDGSIVIGNMFWQSEDRVFRWSAAEGYEFLERLPEPRPRSFAGGASADGLAIVGTYGDGSRYAAFRWSPSEGNVDLGSLVPWSRDAGATDISADGRVIVGYTKSPSSLLNEPFRHTAGTGMVGLGRLDDRTYDGYASATTGHGEAIVGEDFGRGGDTFLWTATCGLEFLQTVLVERFGMRDQLAGWRLTEARDISADGRALVGRAISPAGEYEAYLIRLDHPIFASIPEPAGIELAGGAVAALLLSRRRKGQA